MALLASVSTTHRHAEPKEPPQSRLLGRGSKGET